MSIFLISESAAHFEAPTARAVECLSRIRATLDRQDFVIVDARGACESLEDFQKLAKALASSLGSLMIQNEAGDTVVEVYDRRAGRIEDGARYHQTRQGGDIHTDSVNRPEPMKYLILACAAPAIVGGESIIVTSQKVFSVLRSHPEVLDCLSNEFWFEGRGMNAERGLFKLPVFEVADGRPRFRYLRSYIESAHKRTGEPLLDEQVRAFDILDCVLEMSEFQLRFTLQSGQILIADDTLTFHGRTPFVDGPVPGALSDHRHMLRYWVD